MKIAFKSLCLKLLVLALAQKTVFAQGFPPANINVVSQNNANIAAEISGRLTNLPAMGTLYWR